MDDSAFGLHLAEEANPREAGLPFYIASAANNLGEALELFARYSRIVNEAMRIKLVRAPEGVVAEISLRRPFQTPYEAGYRICDCRHTQGGTRSRRSEYPSNARKFRARKKL